MKGAKNIILTKFFSAGHLRCWGFSSEQKRFFFKVADQKNNAKGG